MSEVDNGNTLTSLPNFNFMGQYVAPQEDNCAWFIRDEA